MRIIIMENNFNFKSSVCTDKVQSERLLALGLKKETADMKYPCTREYYGGVLTEGTSSLSIIIDTEDDDITEYDTPAWSLGRLIKDLMPQSIGCLELAVGSDYAGYYEDRCNSESGMHWEYVEEMPDMFDNIISTIEWLIKEGYFNKEYLV